MPKGRPFPKGQSGNPAGRPPVPAEVRARWRLFTNEVMDALSARLHEPGVSIEQLKSLLESSGDRIGMLTARDDAHVESTETTALSGILSLQTLTEAQRTKVLDDFHERQMTRETQDADK